jgi:hypothetical protein
MSDVITIAPSVALAEARPTATTAQDAVPPTTDGGEASLSLTLGDPPLSVAHPLRARLEATFSEAPEAGSETTEYALVMIVAATIAALALAWARAGAISHLLDGVMAQVRSIFGI